MSWRVKTTMLLTGATLSAMLAAPAQAQYYRYSGPGTTMYGGVPMTRMPQYGAPAPMRDPTQTWQYRFVERAAPIVKGTRDCAFGALGGAAMGSLRGSPAVGLATGCAGALNPNLSPYRPLPVR